IFLFTRCLLHNKFLPYTTLFRSIKATHRPTKANRTRQRLTVSRPLSEQHGAGAHFYPLVFRVILTGLKVLEPQQFQLLSDLMWEHRKSTRLNSSHVSISYVVFSL